MIEQILDIFNEHQMKRGDWPSVLWMNGTTIKALKEQLQEVKRDSSMVNLIQLYGIPVKVDNAIKDFCFETDVQRNERLLTDRKNIWSFSVGGYPIPRSTAFVNFDNNVS